jgi:hypothetical protein
MAPKPIANAETMTLQLLSIAPKAFVSDVGVNHSDSIITPMKSISTIGIRLLMIVDMATTS